MNADGALDLVVSNAGQASQIYLHTGRMTHLPNNPPSVAVTRPGVAIPGGTANAGLFSVGRIISNTRVISIPFTLFDQEGDPATVRAEYSFDGGGRWLPAIAATGTITRSLSASPTGDNHVFAWDIVASGLAGQSDMTTVRMIATSATPTPGPYRYAPSTSTTLPFRLRGTIARVVESSIPPQAVPNALVYHLPSGQVSGATALMNKLTGKLLLSDWQGYVNSRDPLPPGDRLAALQMITDTAKFTLYHTSPISISSGLPETAVDGPAVYPLPIAAERPLIAFNLDISLEWDARSDTAFMAQLKGDLARASELLYDWTDGQAVLGKITIYHDKDHWEDVYGAQGRLITPGANIQIASSNRMRPNSAQGGIGVKTKDPDSAPLGEPSPMTAAR